MRVALIAAGLIVAGALAQAAQTPRDVRRTVWSEVFSAAQAERGAVAYGEHCESCHGADLRGNEGPALVGPSFTRNWVGLSVRDLFRHIRVAMPEDAVSSVSDADKLDILTFIFQKNGFPAGAQPLTLDSEALAGIMFEGKDGPEPPPTGATVYSVGCLENAGPNNWTLTQATAPVRTTLEATHDPDAQDTGISLGAQTLRLIGMSSGGVKAGQKVKVVGLMIQASGTSDVAGVNVFEASRLSEGCN